MRGEEEPEKRMEPSKSSEAVRGQRPQEETTEEREDTSEENPPERTAKVQKRQETQDEQSGSRRADLALFFFYCRSAIIPFVYDRPLI